jgi:hypothetical protein
METLEVLKLNLVFRELRYVSSVAGSISDEAIGFFNWPNPSSRTMAPGSTQHINRNDYQECSWKGKGRPAHKADNITAIYEPIV